MIHERRNRRHRAGNPSLFLERGDDNGDRHGLEIMRDVLERTEGDLHLWPGMLYGTLKELVDAELVVEDADLVPRLFVLAADNGDGTSTLFSIVIEPRRADCDPNAGLHDLVCESLP